MKLFVSLQLTASQSNKHWYTFTSSALWQTLQKDYKIWCHLSSENLKITVNVLFRLKEVRGDVLAKKYSVFWYFKHFNSYLPPSLFSVWFYPLWRFSIVKTTFWRQIKLLYFFIYNSILGHKNSRFSDPPRKLKDHRASSNQKENLE